AVVGVGATAVGAERADPETGLESRAVASAEASGQQCAAAPITSDSRPVDFVDVSGTAFFTADDGKHGRELWKSDGTAAGTALVKSIRPGRRYSDPSSLVDVGGTLFFTADDGTHGQELWKSDGTAGGTVMVKNVNHSGSSYYGPDYLTDVEGTLFFTA